MFLAAVSFCGHNLRHLWGWTPKDTVDSLDPRLQVLLNLERTAADTLQAVQAGGKRKPPESEVQQLQVRLCCASPAAGCMTETWPFVPAAVR